MHEFILLTQGKYTRLGVYGPEDEIKVNMFPMLTVSKMHGRLYFITKHFTLVAS